MFRSVINIFLVLFLGVTSVWASTEVQFGIDTWSTPAYQVRYLPNYNTPNTWYPEAPWVKLQGQYVLADTPVNLSVRHSAVEGTRVDRLDTDIKLDISTGMRIGILPYRIGWCRTYDILNPWISEPDAFCKFSGLNEMSTGSFGTQVYRSINYSTWIIDGLVGVYKPRVDNQVSGLGPYVKIGPDVLHDKYGFSINAINSHNGAQIRTAWLRSHQVQNSTTSYQRQLYYDTYYIGLEKNISDKMEIRATVSAYLGEQANSINKYTWDGKSSTLELIYKPLPGHILTVGASQYINLTNYAKAPHNQSLRVSSKSIAWRVNLPSNSYGIIQYTSSEDSSVPRQSPAINRAGDAFGLRLVKVY